MSANNHACGEKRKADDGKKEKNVARIENALLKTFKVRHHAECRDCFNKAWSYVAKQIRDWRKAGQNQKQTNHDGNDKADDLIS